MVSNVSELDLNKTVEPLREEINKIYYKYIYLRMPLDEYNNIVLSVTKKYNNVDNNKDLILNGIKTKVKKKISEALQNPEVNLDVVNNYIYNKLTKKDDAEDNLKHLINFFEGYLFIPNPNFIIDLLNNNYIFNNIVEKVFKIYSKQIINGDTSKIFDNELFINIIEIYCMLNNIEIKSSYKEVNENDIDNEDGYFDDEYTEAHGSIVNSTSGAYMLSISKYEVLTSEEERELSEKVKKGNKSARERFINCNLKLVVAIAKGYVKSSKLPLMDLVEYGNIGLIEAVERYDGSRGFRFSTYATYWIRREIYLGILEASRNIKLTSPKIKEIGQYRKAVEALEDALKRSPSETEISEQMGLDIEKTREISNLFYDAVSLNEPTGDEDKGELVDIIESPDKTPYELYEEKSLPYYIEELFRRSKLNDREKEVILYRYGFKSDKPKTLEEIGKMYSITRERVRQIEEKALSKLRNTKYVESLIVYTNYPARSRKYLEYYRKENKYYSSKSPLGTKRSIKNMESINAKREELAGEAKEKDSNIKYDVVDNKDYSTLVDLINEPQIRKLFIKLSIHEVITFILIMGYVNGKCFTTNAIAKLLRIKEEKVIDHSKKVLTEYKAYLTAVLEEYKKENNTLNR